MLKWAEDIRLKTKNMDRDARLEYVLCYYWHHLLLGTLLFGLLLLGIYHAAWGRRKPDFSVAVVNQEIDLARDQEIQEEFAAFAGLSPKQVQVDSDYLTSYDTATDDSVWNGAYRSTGLKGMEQSSFEKFFLGWQAGAIDAVVIPQSFYRYCKSQNGTFLELSELEGYKETDAGEGKHAQEALERGTDGRQLFFVDEDGACTGVYVEHTGMSGDFAHNGKDPYILVFPADMAHKEAAGKFLEYCLYR